MLKRWMSLLGLVCLAVLLTVLPVLWATAEPSQGFVQPASSIPSKYDWTKTTPWRGTHFSEGLAAVCYDNDRRCGYMNKAGELVIMTEFTFADSFHDGMAGVSMKASRISQYRPNRNYPKYGFIDKSGKMVIPRKFDLFGNFSEGLAAVKIQDRWGYINKQGKLVIRPRFYDASEFHGGVASVHINGGRDAIINTKGRIIRIFRSRQELPNLGTLVKREPPHFSEGLIPAFDNRRGFGYMNSKGRLVVPYQFSSADSFVEGLAAVSKRVSLSDNTSELTFAGYIDKNGKVVISLNVEELKSNGMMNQPFDFSEGLALVRGKSECKYIDRVGRTTITITNTLDCESFSNGLALIAPDVSASIQSNESKDGAYYIDKSGRTIFALNFRDVSSFFQEGLAYAILTTQPHSRQNDVYLDTQGKVAFRSPFRND
jgi:WG containing repeat